MAAPPSDLAFAQAVLEGQVATRGPWHAQRQQAGRGRGGRTSGRAAGQLGGRALGGRHPAGGAAKRRRHGQQQRQQQQQPEAAARPPPQQQATSSTSSSSSEQSSSSSSDGNGSQLAAYSRPGPRSTARAAHCTACDVWVPRRVGDWEVSKRSKNSRNFHPLLLLACLPYGHMLAAVRCCFAFCSRAGRCGHRAHAVPWLGPPPFPPNVLPRAAAHCGPAHRCT